MKYPTLQEERKFWKKGYKRVICLDEAGRGPLAGPVAAAAVAIKKFSIARAEREREMKTQSLATFNFQFSKIQDSKKLTPKKRKEFYEIITKHPFIGWGTGRVSEKVIDKINILEATKLAMLRAIQDLEKKSHFTINTMASIRKQSDFLILDGKIKLDFPACSERGRTVPQKSIVKADEKVFSCAAASIIAKVHRDGIMERYHKKYPQYGFDEHKGYPTKYHKKMLKKYGPCKIHRMSFRPVLKIKNKKLDT